jgi:hypothetical protein
LVLEATEDLLLMRPALVVLGAQRHFPALELLQLLAMAAQPVALQWEQLGLLLALLGVQRRAGILILRAVALAAQQINNQTGGEPPPAGVPWVGVALHIHPAPHRFQLVAAQLVVQVLVAVVRASLTRVAQVEVALALRQLKMGQAPTPVEPLQQRRSGIFQPRRLS